MKGKQASVMVWVAVSSSVNHTELVIMDKDSTSRRGGYTVISYISTLEEGLLPIYEGQVFMQDNAPIHRAQRTLNWFADQGIFVYQG